MDEIKKQKVCKTETPANIVLRAYIAFNEKNKEVDNEV